MNDTEAEVTPALYDHAVRVYEEMMKRSHKEHRGPIGQEMELDLTDEDLVDVYEGHLTRLFADLQIANPYYTKIRNALVGQSCIEQIRRGGGVATSKWVLHRPPDEETFRAIMDRRHGGPKGKNAILEQRVGDLMKLTSSLQDQVSSLEEAFQKLYDDVQTMPRGK